MFSNRDKAVAYGQQQQANQRRICASGAAEGVYVAQQQEGHQQDSREKTDTCHHQRRPAFPPQCE